MCCFVLWSFYLVGNPHLSSVHPQTHIMANPTVVLITGVSIGLGNVLAAAAYLLRPDHTVIGSVRDARAPSVQELTKLRTAEGSRLVLVSIENTSATDAKKKSRGH